MSDSVEEAPAKVEEAAPVKPEEAKPEHVQDSTHDIIKSLTERIDSLETVVAGLTDHGSKDSAPISRPWTHRG